jgi:hypothetical protein
MSNAILGGAINPPIPQPINAPYPRRLPSGCVMAIDTSDGRPGVARTNLIPADKVTFVGWTAGTGETITLTQGQTLEYGGNTYTDATRILGNGAGSDTGKYIYNVGSKILGQPYSYGVVVKNNGLADIRVNMLINNVSVTVTPGETKYVQIANNISDGTTDNFIRFFTLASSDVLDIIAYQPMVSATPYVCAYDNSPAIAAITPARLLDRTGLSAGASISGAVPVLGLYGNHYRFDGVDDKFTVVGDRIGVGDVTFECWCRPTSYGGVNLGRVIDNGRFVIFTTAGRFTHNTNDGGGGSLVYSDINSITLNSWHHLVMVRKSNGNTTFYVNGVLSGTADQASGTPASGTTDTIIGNRAAGDRAFAGDYAYPNIYNRIMSAQEINNLYRANAWRYGIAA